MRVVYWAFTPLARAELIDRLSAVPGGELVVAKTLQEVLEALPGAQGLVLYDVPEADARQVADAARAPDATLRWMHFVSAGREGFNAVGFPEGVAVSDSAGGAAPAVAEHAMALALALCRSLPTVLAQQAEHKWDRFPPMSRASSLEGAAMAIVGFGHIGKEIARRARAFGARITSVSRAAPAHPLADEAQPLSALHDVLSRADIVMVAIALAEQTRGLFGRDAFARMKRGALFVNVARGGLVDQAALADALKSGALAGAAIDAMSPEPLPPDDPLWDCPNLIISPHFGGAGAMTMARLAGGAAENMRRVMAGEALLNQVSA